MIQANVHIALVLKDYDEAIEFYTKKLHFELVEDTYQPEQDYVTPFARAGRLLSPANAG